MSHPIEIFASTVIADARDAVHDIDIENNIPFSPELYISWDDEKGQVAPKGRTKPGILLQLDAEVAVPPRWFSLNIGLGKSALKAGDVLGLVLEIESETGFGSDLFCRSATEDAYSDTYLQGGFDVTGGRQIVTILHTIEPGDSLEQDAFHTLVMPLPGQNFSLTLRDMRLFVLGAERGLRSTPFTAASAG